MFIMKKLILLLLLELFLQVIYCNDDILSKFHQYSFKVRDIRWELRSYNEDYYNFFQIKTFKFNRTIAAINATMNMKVTVKDKMEVVVQVYKFLSNEYRHFPIRFQVNIKKVADTNALGIKEMMNCGNIRNFSFEKDVTYYVCNFVIDDTHLPPLIPSGRYKVDHTLLYLNKEIALLVGYGEVYTPIAYPEN